YERLSHDVTQLKMPGVDNGRTSVACAGQGTRKLSTGCSREEKPKKTSRNSVLPRARPLLPKRVRMTRYNQYVQLPGQPRSCRGRRLTTSYVEGFQSAT